MNCNAVSAIKPFQANHTEMTMRSPTQGQNLTNANFATKSLPEEQTKPNMITYNHKHNVNRIWSCYVCNSLNLLKVIGTRFSLFFSSLIFYTIFPIFKRHKLDFLFTVCTFFLFSHFKAFFF